MAAKKRNGPQARAKQAAQARRAAEQARQRRVRRERRMTVGAVVAVIATVGIVAALAFGGSEGTDLATSPSTTGPSANAGGGAPSAAGKPCVPVADALPPGAPAVPVEVGPPPTELVTDDLKEGTGAVVTQGQTLTVNYIGVSCSTGAIFDSSYGNGEPATFSLSRVIRGWQEGIPGMKVGGQRLLGIPPELGYGQDGKGPDIGPGESLWFVVEVLDAKVA